MPRLALPILVLAAAILANGCVSDARRKAAENAAVKTEAAKEIDRICALPEPERAAELKKLKEESGFELYCARPDN